MSYSREDYFLKTSLLVQNRYTTHVFRNAIIAKPAISHVLHIVIRSSIPLIKERMHTPIPEGYFVVQFKFQKFAPRSPERAGKL